MTEPRDNPGLTRSFNDTVKQRLKRDPEFRRLVIEEIKQAGAAPEEDGPVEDGPSEAERYGPGSFGCHEALDRASILMDQVYELSGHGAVKLDPEWEALATKAGDALWDLYQAIGAAHLGGGEVEESDVRTKG